MRLSYETPPYDYNQEEILESEIDDSVETETSASSRIKKQWDEDCPWTEWYSAEDPIRGNQVQFFFLRYNSFLPCFLIEKYIPWNFILLSFVYMDKFEVVFSYKRGK